MNQFGNAFIRQMGREVAHSTYKNATSYDSTLRDLDGNFVTRFVSNDYVYFLFACIGGFFLPYVMIIPFICGLIRVFGRKIKGHMRGTYAITKADARTITGRKYIGQDQAWVTVKKPKEECTKEEIQTARLFGIGEIVLSVVAFVLLLNIWGTFLS